MRLKLTLDFESRSEADLKVVGAWMYSIHPTTDAMCLSWRCSNGETGMWAMGEDVPISLFELMHAGDALCVAHNAFFERAIWINVCVKKYCWPPAIEANWRCSAAQAAACSLPRALDKAGQVLKLDVVKDAEGKRVMMKLSRPAKATKNKPKRWNEDTDDLLTLWEYCETDTAAEEALSARLPALSAREQKVWEMSERMNVRGIPIDVEGAKKAIQLAETHVIKSNKELLAITHTIDTATKRAKVLKWLQDHGNNVKDTTGPTLDRLLSSVDLKPKSRRVVEIVRSVGRTSTKKYDAMIAMACPDARARGTMMYHGASTGRWAGMGLQPHNYPRGSFENMDLAWQYIHNGNLEDIELSYGDPMMFLSHALRGAIKAPDGRILYCGDYASIEARKIMWLADEKHGLEVFRKKGDIYLDLASDIYGHEVKKHEKKKRMFGKQGILGLGFGMGFVKFLITCRSYGIEFTTQQIIDIVGARELNDLALWVRTDGWKQVKKTMPEATQDDVLPLALMKYVVERYRTRYKSIPALWKAYDEGAILAVKNPGKIYKTGKVMWQYKDIFLSCRLPSGRLMRYPFPRIDDKGRSERLIYMGVDSMTHQWVEIGTYGGKLAENATQASARDVMADGLVNVEASGIYDPIASIHDEGISEADKDKGDVDQYLELLITGSTSWCPDLPLAAEGWRAQRYHKE